MVQNVNANGSFKRMEVIGATKEEALAKAPFSGYQKDATQAYRKWREKQKNGITDSDLKQFMLAYLEKNTNNIPGVGCYIVLESAISDTRERPYKIEDVKNESGAREVAKVFQLINPESGAVLAETDVKRVAKTDKDGNEIKDEDGNTRMVWKSATKAEAKELAKSLYTVHGYTGDIEARITKQVVAGEDIAFRVKYAPSKNARVGRYLAFGVTAD